MQQTPVHEFHNDDLLRAMPAKSMRVIEVGCSSGALAREFKKINAACDYVGIEIDPVYAELARRHCDSCEVLNIEQADAAFWQANADRDCWVFGDTLEHMQDPWKVLQQVRQVMPAHGVVVACIPNMQHWSIQVRLSMGDIRYEPSGLLDKTHLRWFTRQTMLELFRNHGFQVTGCLPRIFNEPMRAKFLPMIESMASLLGADSRIMVADAMPLQYILTAVAESQ
jgi:ubiquinone/menaquinone biosynthesis C-methylase UbiE